MLLATFEKMGLIPLIQSPFSASSYSHFFGLSQALILSSTLAVSEVNMNARHTGKGVEMIGALKNLAKVAEHFLDGLLIDWQSYA